LDGKVALVSGGARGLGESVSRLFVEEGALVVLGDVLHDRGNEVAADLLDSGHYAALDVRDGTDWERAVDLAVGRFGRLDILVNNAAILHYASILETTEEDYRRVIDVNQVGCFLGMKAAGAVMVEQGSGSIVNVSSSQGLVGASYLAPYVASKFAVRGMTKVAAIEWGPYGVRVNSVHPWGIETPMGDEESVRNIPGGIRAMDGDCPLKPSCTPREVASLILFLASDEASHSTGSEFVCDGGWLAGPELSDSRR
jgi:3alpha(or 20beta)-hydroxysteroid dehydrogenase